MTKWEYKRVGEYMSQRELNELGSDGWELVSHSVVNRHGTFDSGTITHYYIFKRLIVE